MSTDVTIGDIVISIDAVQHDFDVTAFGSKPGEIARMYTSEFKADGKLIALAQSVAEGLDAVIEVVQGRISTGDQFIVSKEKQDWITENLAAHIVEMEEATIGQVAHSLRNYSCYL
ncbi:hypothetical protein [Sporosarcina sp. A2]|uniref:phosphorylase family protein n=1 Tax=Sporosarcina sp. A2 TaxID=3393449 RepID=UPI003D7BEF4B